MNICIPDSCTECKFCTFDEYFDEDIEDEYCYLTGESCQPDYRNGDCPLIGVPENRLFMIHDGVIYSAKVEIPKGKSIKIPELNKGMVLDDIRNML